MSKHARFRRIYVEAQKLLGTVLEASLKTLEHFGCGRRDESKFEDELRRSLVTLLTCPEDEYPLSQLDIDGGVRGKRKALVAEVISAFGGEKRDVDWLTGLICDADPHIVAVGVFSHQPMIRMDSKWTQINRELRQMFAEACALHRRLRDMLEDIRTPYKGTARDPEPGVDQTIALLKKFPDVAEPIYEAAGITGLAGYPPVETEKTLNYEGRQFKKDVEREQRAERRWSIFKIAGLIVVGIAATVITAATLGTGAAILVGVGIGLAHGTYSVVKAHGELQHTQDAAAIGLASPMRVDYARGELQGAYALLVIDVATGGILARFGGSQSISGLMRMTRITAISGAAGGLGMACNPNTWRSENAGAIILFGTVMGAATGAGGHALGAGTGRLFRAGSKVQIGVARAEGVLEKGRTVKVMIDAGDVPVPAKVVAVNKKDCTVTLKLEGKNTVIKIGKAAQVSGDIFSKQTQMKGLRPVCKDDVGPVTTECYLTKGQIPVEGSVYKAPGNKLMFQPKSGAKACEVGLQDLSLVDAKLHARAAGIKVKDLDYLRQYSTDFELFRTPGTRGLFTAVDRHNGRLRIIPGKTQDHNGAFRGWSYEPLPQFNMRGRGALPQANQVAMFMTHGSPSGFAGANTRQAARAMADAIVTANAKVGAGGNQIKFVNLSSCSQGSRRFILLGKTNAEVFQEHLNMRLRELGIDPRGPRGITVLAADRPGLLYGADQFKSFGKFNRSDFVPAGTQRPNSYRLDTVSSAPWTAMDKLTMTNVLVGTAGGVAVICVADQRDPFGVFNWISTNSDKVIGYAFEAKEPEPITLELPKASGFGR